jgi:hypothetical protein
MLKAKKEKHQVTCKANSSEQEISQQTPKNQVGHGMRYFKH